MNDDQYTGYFNGNYYYNNLCVASAVSSVLGLPFSFKWSNPFRYVKVVHPGACVYGYDSSGNGTHIPCMSHMGHSLTVTYTVKFTVGEPDTPFKGNAYSVLQ